MTIVVEDEPPGLAVVIGGGGGGGYKKDILFSSFFFFLFVGDLNGEIRQVNVEEVYGVGGWVGEGDGVSIYEGRRGPVRGR